MRFSSLALFISFCLAKTILLTNDDGWASTNIRATYRSLKAAGHQVVLVAPVAQRSGWGGKFDTPSTPKLLTNGEFNYRVKGDPSWGHEDDDQGIWYFNGTPASCVAFGVNYVIPKYFHNASVDLVVAGPNEGVNTGPGLFTLSGTMGATYNAAYRGLAAIAFSGSNANNSFFKDSLDEDPLSSSNIYAKLVVDMVAQLFEAQGKSSRVLPLGVGLNVNFPLVGYDSENDSCTQPDWVSSRISGFDSIGPDFVVDEANMKILRSDFYSKALETCLNGDCSLPSESSVIKQRKCSSAVSAFSIDYDANAQLRTEVGTLLAPLISSQTQKAIRLPK